MTLGKTVSQVVRLEHPVINGFKNFIMRGNVIDLAVAVVIGTAFTALVTSIVSSVFNPLIAAVFQADSLAESLVVRLPDGSKILFGLVIGALINFLLIAGVVYFLVVLPLNRLKATQERRRAAGVPSAIVADPTTELDILTEIRDLLAKNASADQPTPPSA